MNRTILIHDLEPEAAALGAVPEGTYVFPALPQVKHCVGCFGCWTRTPGRCVIRDREEALLRHMADCDKVIVISRCVYGGLSPQVKRVWDRCIGHVQPFFYIQKESGEMHHVPRYKKAELAVYFWGEVTDGERDTARRLVEGNGINFNMEISALGFYGTPGDMGEVFR